MPTAIPMDLMAAFLLVFFRITGMTLSAPLFSNRAFPVRLRIWMAFSLAVLCFPLATNTVPPGTFTQVFRHPVSIAMAVGSELALGWALGFVASVMVWGAQLAGHILDQEIGLSIGSVFDPITGSQGSVSTQLFFTFGLLAFVLLDGHHLVVISAAQTLRQIPPGSFPFNMASGELLLYEAGGQIWTVGVRIAIPGMVALLLVTVAMAVLARVVPEMNIFILGFAVRIVFGLLITLLALPFVADVFRELIVSGDVMLARFIDLLERG